MIAFGCKSPRTTRLRSSSFGWLAVAAFSVMGCGSRHEELVAFLRSHEAEVSTGHYLVRPPDSISIHAPGAPEIDGTSPMVRPHSRQNSGSR